MSFDMDAFFAAFCARSIAFPREPAVASLTPPSP